jgi:EAL domain-containing protein (putative c-di-GMP-specific phosphodiesterase class I)
MVGRGSNAPGLEDLYVVVSAATTTLVMLMLARRPAAAILRYRLLAWSVALTGVAMIVLDIAPSRGLTVTTSVANGLFLSGGVLSMVVIVPSLYRRLDAKALAATALDGAIVFGAGVTLMLTVWHTGGEVGGISGLIVPILAAALLASAGVAAIVAFTLRATPAFRGVWSGIAAVSIVGLSWILWVDLLFRGQARDMPTSLLYSGGILLCGYAWMTWTDDVGGSARYERIARILVDWMPIGAIALCVAVAALPHAPIQGIDPARAGTAVVVMLSMIRQRLLIVRERWASQRLAREVEERAQTMVSLARLERGNNLEKTAARICAEALRLEGIDNAGVYVFGPSGDVVPLAVAGEHRPDDLAHEPLSACRSLHMRARAGLGAWIDTAVIDPETAIGPLLGEAFAPMRCDDRVVGVVSMGTTGEANARRLAGRLSTLTEFGVVSAALLGAMLSDHWQLAETRSQLESIIAERAFTPVFQAVVRLENRETVGFEALTRFHDGKRPDQRFAEAHNSGMTVRLETACLAEQIEAAMWLPAGSWVSLNVSPALAAAIVPLIATLERADRDVVLEITEHVEIADYRQLVGALDLVRGRARLAVDDAGAGYAGLRHILELRPQFVKLDISLVRHVDTDQARQAMVAGMAHFARNAGCQLIAEGIETEDELAELIRLGVEFGQGYLLGRPAPIAAD